MTEPYIKVMNIAELQESGAADMAHHYNMDEGALAMPERLGLGERTWDGHIIETYNQQVGEYDVWLEDQVKAAEPSVLKAIDDIYNLAIRQGVILVVRAAPTPFVTHAHMVKNLIIKLAGNQEDELQAKAE